MVPGKRWQWQSMGKGLILGVLLTSFLMLLYGVCMPPLHFQQIPGFCVDHTAQTQRTSATISKNACAPKINLMFLKTHKTASSTFLNILFRFGEKHDLRFAFPDSRNDFFYPELFHRSHVRGYQSGMCFNVVCNHMRFNGPEVAQLLPEDASYITILRDPGELFESSFHYFKTLIPLTWSIPTRDKLDEFLQHPWRYYRSSSFNSFYLKNLLFFDLGYDNTLDPDDPLVEEAIQETSERFQLVMIAEYFEESLILLKDTLCWEMEDLLFFKLNARRDSSVSHLTQVQRARALEWNGADWRLYQHFNTTFWKKVNTFGRERMAQEVAELRQRNQEMVDACIEGGQAVEAGRIQDAAFQPWQPVGERSIMGYNLKRYIEPNHQELCRKMLTPEIQYLSKLGVNLWVTKMWGHVKDLISW